MTDAEFDEEPELFQCAECPYRLERQRLSAHDEEVLALHTQLSGRAVQDLHLTRLVFETARLQMTASEARTLVPKLELIHEFANPVGDASGGDESDGREALESAGPARPRRRASPRGHLPHELGVSEDDF